MRFGIGWFQRKKVCQAIILKPEFLAANVKNLKAVEKISKVIIGNGTSSKENIKKLSFIKQDLIIVEEKNTTYRAKERYFELFPISGIKKLIPREIFILNLNLDALSALIILEDYCNFRFTLSSSAEIKTWMK